MPAFDPAATHDVTESVDLSTSEVSEHAPLSGVISDRVYSTGWMHPSLKGA